MAVKNYLVKAATDDPQLLIHDLIELKMRADALGL
ncbi:hypothetical protein ABIB82_003918 [Bradyrhizobium sp. i1.8.4]